MSNSTKSALQTTELTVNDRFFMLYDRMLGDVSVPKVLHHVSTVVCDALNAERTSIFLVREETGELESVAVVGNVPKSIRIPIDYSSLAGYCAKTGKAFIVDDAYGDLSDVDPAVKFDERWDRLHRFKTRDVVCAPAHFRGEILGVCEVLNSKSGGFKRTHLRALESIARLVGYALYHAKLYEQLSDMKRLDLEKATFMRTMVHELKAPVAAARMLIDAASDPETANDEREELYQNVGHRLDDLMAMIQGLLAFSRVKSGQALGEIKVVDAVYELRSCCEHYRDLARAKGLEFRLHTPTTRLPLRIDVKGLHMILSNLLGNAVKYTAKGHVQASIAADEAHLRIVVEDSGIGIPSDETEGIFKEFYRASNARQAQIEGSGVGLAGVKALVDRFGGQICFTSEAGKGSTFTITLPRFVGAMDGEPVAR